MGLRLKLILVVVVLGFIPVLLIGGLMYRESIESIELRLRSDAERDANGIASRIETTLRESEIALAELARSPAIRNFVGSADDSSQLQKPDKRDNKLREIDARQGQTKRDLPDELKESIRAFVLSNPDRYSSITCLSTSREPLYRVEPVRTDNGVGKTANNVNVNFKTENFVRSALNVDPRVWTTSEQTPLRSPLAIEPQGATLNYSIPIFQIGAGEGVPRGALIVGLNCNALFDEAIREHFNPGLQASATSSAITSKRFVIVLDNSGDVLYHTNQVYRHQKVHSALPTFKDVSSAMIAGESGSKFFSKDGSAWLVAYRPAAGLTSSVAVCENYTVATAGVKRIGWIAFSLFSLFGLATVFALGHMLQNTARSIERVTEGAVAIAGGKLEQRIEVRSNDETRLLAESFNIMTDRLRDQIARESESRQFESFMRISAMLTHDLKNAIAGLSLLVGNMGRKFHHEEFRADAMTSLVEATDKLRNLVAKLSEPVQTLSSEHKMARPTDLVPLIRKAVANIVDPASDMHEIEVQLPATLVATVEADRIEKVFENLLINAIEAMAAKRGKLIVEAGEAPTDEVFFRVSDTGPGISLEFQRAKLFRPFATTKKTGIGLGLYACREIIEAHGGRIEVISSRGSGATFRAVIPSAPKIKDSATVTPA
jgi:signal transduction histidine kinase